MPLESDRKDIALLVLDLEGSSEYLREVGDTYFSNTVGKMYNRVKKHEAAKDLLFLKSTGGGFLAVFTTAASALALAKSFLDSPVRADIHVRMALHWGLAKVAPDGDVLGVEVHRAFRIQNVQMPEQVDDAYDGAPIPFSDRIVITADCLERLEKPEQAKFRYAGRYKLKGFEETSDIWVLQK